MKLPHWIKIPIWLYLIIWVWIIIGLLADGIQLHSLDWGAGYVLKPWAVYGIPILALAIGISYIIWLIVHEIKTRYSQ